MADVKISALAADTSPTFDDLLVAVDSGTSATKKITIGQLFKGLGIVDVAQYGALGDGATDDKAAITSAIAALPASGGILKFQGGDYHLHSDVSIGAKEILFLMSPDVRFSGAGSPPTTITNTDIEFSAPIGIMKYPDGDDGYGIVVDLDVQPAATGEHVAGYFGIRAEAASAAYIWGLNTLVDLQPGYIAANAVGMEIDVANYAAVGLGVGLLVTGLGDFTCGYGLNVTRVDTDSDWSTGVVIQHSTIGMIIDGTDVVAPSFALKIDHYQQGHIQLVPTSDATPTQVMFGVANAAEGQHNFSITKGGSFTTRGAMSMVEMTAPAGVANQAVVFSQDNGAGKTQLMVIFPTGVAKQIAIET